MDDDFQQKVLDQLAALRGDLSEALTSLEGVGHQAADISTLDDVQSEQAKHRGRMDAIVARLEDVETMQERLHQKMDRTQKAAMTAFEAGEQA